MREFLFYTRAEWNHDSIAGFRTDVRRCRAAVGDPGHELPGRIVIVVQDIDHDQASTFSLAVAVALALTAHAGSALAGDLTGASPIR
jgi:hypothetical protein